MSVAWTPRTSTEREAQRRFPSWRIAKLTATSALLVPSRSGGLEAADERRWVGLDQITAGDLAHRVTT